MLPSLGRECYGAHHLPPNLRGISAVYAVQRACSCTKRALLQFGQCTEYCCACMERLAFQLVSHMVWYPAIRGPAWHVSPLHTARYPLSTASYPAGRPRRPSFGCGSCSKEWSLHPVLRCTVAQPCSFGAPPRKARTRSGSLRTTQRLTGAQQSDLTLSPAVFTAAARRHVCFRRCCN